MQMTWLPYRSPLDAYDHQAADLLQAFRAGDAFALSVFKCHHPKFLRSDIPWLPKDMSDDEIRNTPVDLDDARMAVARGYNFRDWAALVQYVAQVTDDHSPVYRFESAVEAVINGDLVGLERMLRETLEVVRMRSTRVTNFDPPVHRATLVHYLGVNGVEGYRQRSPKNAADIARALLQAGADANAFADMYGGQYATMSMLVSSSPPAEAGVQVALINALVDFGAIVEPLGSDKWGAPIITALTFGFRDAAEALVRRGARIDNLAAAAGLGRLDDARRLLPTADGQTRHRALALAAQHGNVEILRLLVDAGEDMNRYNPDGHHMHTTPLHQAVFAGQEAAVRFLVERGARLDIKDTTYHSTPLGWAVYAQQHSIADYLRAQGAA